MEKQIMFLFPDWVYIIDSKGQKSEPVSASFSRNIVLLAKLPSRRSEIKPGDRIAFEGGDKHGQVFIILRGEAHPLPNSSDAWKLVVEMKS